MSKRNPTECCVVPGCLSRGNDSRGMCSSHYHRLRRYGDPQREVVTRSGFTVQRLLARVDQSAGPDGCWPWLGTVDSEGYSQAHFAGRTRRGYRLSYETFVGLVPAGMTVDHTCHDPLICTPGVKCTHRRCVNPAHLEAVEKVVNTMRGGSPQALNARKTHCKRGHPLEGENLYIIPSTGSRACRTCTRARQVEWRWRVNSRLRATLQA